MDYGKVREALADLDEELFCECLDEFAKSDEPNADGLMQAIQEGMAIVGERYEKQEYYVSDLMYAADILQDNMGKVNEKIAASGSQKIGKVILCTVKDDLHDIGKNIVKSMLEAAQIEVLDLGIDTPPEKIIEAAKAENIRVILLSGVLTLAIASMENTVKAFVEAGLRDQVKIMIGGYCVSEAACEKTKADEWAYSPAKTVNVCKQWLAQ